MIILPEQKRKLGYRGAVMKELIDEKKDPIYLSSINLFTTYFIRGIYPSPKMKNLYKKSLRFGIDKFSEERPAVLEIYSRFVRHQRLWNFCFVQHDVDYDEWCSIFTFLKSGANRPDFDGIDELKQFWDENPRRDRRDLIERTSIGM